MLCILPLLDDHTAGACLLHPDRGLALGGRGKEFAAALLLFEARQVAHSTDLILSAEEVLQSGLSLSLAAFVIAFCTSEASLDSQFYKLLPFQVFNHRGQSSQTHLTIHRLV